MVFLMAMEKTAASAMDCAMKNRPIVKLYCNALAPIKQEKNIPANRVRQMAIFSVMLLLYPHPPTLYPIMTLMKVKKKTEGGG